MQPTVTTAWLGASRYQLQWLQHDKRGKLFGEQHVPLLTQQQNGGDDMAAGSGPACAMKTTTTTMTMTTMRLE